MNDFGYSGNKGEGSTVEDVKTDIDTGKEDVKDGTTNISNDPVPPADDVDKNKPNDGDNPDGNKDGDNTGEVNNLEPGTNVEIGDAKYTVNEVGDLVDAEGNVFKYAKEVNDYLKSLEGSEETPDEFTIQNIMDTVGIDVVDENGKAVAFDNTPEGVNSYINSVMDIKENEIRESQMNTLFKEIPELQSMLNFYYANGRSFEGYNKIQDRSQITVDDNDEAQQEAIIRQSYKEFGKHGDVTSYIAYLKSSGMLADVAKTELAALQEADKQTKQQLEQEAEKRIREDEEESIAYWNQVKTTIDGRKLAGYEIPANFTIERDGKKYAATPNDFFNYVYQVDENGVTRYQKDLEAIDPQKAYEDDLLRAYLTFTGGNYSSLVNMAIKEKEVKTLRYKANKTAPSGIKITKPNSKKSNSSDIDFGY